jgi:DNA-binding NarL/FixJ family response regulator
VVEAKGGEVESVARVFLVDDHEVVRVGVRELLNSSDDLEVVGEPAPPAEG